MEKSTSTAGGTAATPPPHLPVLIIGSGTTGLALAQGLRKAGIACIVFEKNSAKHGGRDWNMGLHWGVSALKALMPDGWWDRIQSVQVDPNVPTKELDTIRWLQGDTGELVMSFDLGPFYRLRRSKLRDLLSQGLDMQYDKRLQDISYAKHGQSVTAHFADGSAITGSMLVSADGARSSTRQMLLGRELGTLNHLPYAATFIQSKFTVEQALYLRSFHPLYLGLWYLGMKDWDPALPGHRWDNHNGLVTMVGDAVHPMTFQRGQGLNHAVTDAEKLCRAITRIRAGEDRRAMLDAFEDEMITRGGTEVREGTANTVRLHDWERVRESPLFKNGMNKVDA
ncbi:hypothetical protein CFE70_008490 [Pyrenophora teres f. teres 0-1]